MRTIAILCAAPKSVYKTLAGLEVYDPARDSLTFPGGSPVVTHPPCRAWSIHCRHQAKPAPGEKDLGLFCAAMLEKWGGVLEQPAHSLLFKEAGLPLPPHSRGHLWSMEVCQAWWGYPMLKKTWLCFSRIPRKAIQIPIVLHPHGGDRRREQIMSKQQRSATPRAFAEWLVECARQAS